MEESGLGKQGAGEVAEAEAARLRLIVASASALVGLAGESAEVEIGFGVTTPDVVDAIEALGGERHVSVYDAHPVVTDIDGPYAIEGIQADLGGVRIRAQLRHRPATADEVARLNASKPDDRRAITIHPEARS